MASNRVHTGGQVVFPELGLCLDEADEQLDGGVLIFLVADLDAIPHGIEHQWNEVGVILALVSFERIEQRAARAEASNLHRNDLVGEAVLDGLLEVGMVRLEEGAVGE